MYVLFPLLLPFILIRLLYGSSICKTSLSRLFSASGNVLVSYLRHVPNTGTHAFTKSIHLQSLLLLFFGVGFFNNNLKKNKKSSRVSLQSFSLCVNKKSNEKGNRLERGWVCQFMSMHLNIHIMNMHLLTPSIRVVVCQRVCLIKTSSVSFAYSRPAFFLSAPTHEFKI